ncbi:exodeoxyribonuclease VII small subunit [Candidatus Curtissbacteria bacterium RBG_13_35_7]|uniref:Exodeoxyribonuclease 7 small subunit n=1 Tax=Candidatus Curtissbacteria bacterium RBG_13_35_7 TaxID=1797705 RepID=A0A1F5G211_9BACT|nr:MAG: exodeoxyribonuclease VII small subunit [Candidatus Curtissbacteria bacterium RBG_13_35_7]
MAKVFNFSKALNRLEEIVQALEDPQIELEQGMKLFEEGIKIHKLCQQELKSTKAKIDKIITPKGGE